MFAVLSLLFAIALQIAAPKPEFEAASVRSEQSSRGTAFFPPKGGPGTDDPTTWRFQSASLSALIGIAYEKKFFEISGPGWTEEDLFTITAKLPPATTVRAFHLMLRNLLADRFRLQLHYETKQMPGYVLAVAQGGPKFTSTVADLNPPPKVNEGPGRDENGYPIFPRGSGITMAIINGKARFHLTGESLPHFAEQLSFQLRGPVRDETELSGKYDIDVHWDARTTPSADGDPGPDLIHAVREQLGLSIQSRRVPVEMIVIDRAERVPSEN